MMGERKIELEEWPASRCRRQTGQDPHATPAFAGLFEEHAVAPPHKGMRLREVDGSWSFFLNRQQGWVLGAAKRADRTFGATGLAWKTDHRAEVHQRRVVFARARGGEERGRGLPEMSATGGGVNRILPIR